MKIYKVKLTETGAIIAWNIHYGIAASVEDAMADALRSERELSGDEIDPEVLSVELIADCSFAPASVELAA